MELQWPLILFTTFVTWSAGLFGTQGVAALAGEGRRAQMPALIASAVNVVLTGAYLFAMEAAGASYTEVGYYFDPTRPTHGMGDMAALSPLALAGPSALANGPLCFFPRGCAELVAVLPRC